MIESGNDHILKKGLDQLYEKYASSWLDTDPIQIPHLYKNKNDIETVGFISAMFSYGKVGLFTPVIRKILKYLGPSPYESLLNFKRNDINSIEDIYYRFQTAPDIKNFLWILSIILNDYSTLENFFLKGYAASDKNTLTAIALFNTTIHDIIERENIRLSYGLNHLLPVSGRGAMKRMNMYLRWMVRKDNVDFGIWKKISSSQLVIPLDTHIHRLAGFLGLSSRSSANFTSAIEITDNLKKFCPEDPVKYDFSLTRLSMFACSKFSSLCSECIVKDACKYYKSLI